MIFCQNNIYGKVWKVMKKTDKYMDIQMTTSEKGQDGNYINSGWFPRLIGHAFNALKDTLKEGDRIIVKKSKLTNERYTSDDGSLKSSFRFLILEAEIEAARAEQTASTAPTTQEPEVSEAKDESPW